MLASLLVVVAVFAPFGGFAPRAGVAARGVGSWSSRDRCMWHRVRGCGRCGGGQRDEGGRAGRHAGGWGRVRGARVRCCSPQSRRRVRWLPRLLDEMSTSTVGDAILRAVRDLGDRSALVVTPGGWLALLIGWVGGSWALLGLVGHRNDRVASPASADPDGSSTRVRRHRTGVGDGSHRAAQRVRRHPRPCSSDERARLDDGVGIRVNDLRGVAGGGGPSGRDWCRSTAGWSSRSRRRPRSRRWCTPASSAVREFSCISFAPIVLGSSVAVHLAFALAGATVVIGLAAGPTLSMSRASWRGRLWRRWVSWSCSAPSVR